MKTLTLILILAASTFGQIVVTAPRGTVGQGDFDVTVNAGPDLTGLIAYQFNIYYDPSVIAVPPTEAENFGCTTEGTLAENLIAVCNGYEPGLLRVVVYGANELTGGSGAILIVHFHSVGTGTSKLCFRNGRMWLWPQGEVASSYKNGLVTVE